MTEEALKRLRVPMVEYHYQCQCGGVGKISTRQSALAPLVRLARADHEGKCGDPDIESIETPEEYAKRKQPKQPTAEQLGEGFC